MTKHSSNRNKYWKSYWKRYGENYLKNWQKLGNQVICDQELAFIHTYLSRCTHCTALDIGVGTGRITDSLLQTNAVKEMFCLDYSTSMVAYCKNKYKTNSKVKRVMAYDISKDTFPFKQKFDVITAIRILKYNKNWKRILQHIAAHLQYNGILVFSMPNKFSLNSLNGIHVERTSVSELSSAVSNANMNVVKITSFSKLPDLLYASPNPKFITRVVHLEKFLQWLIGDTVFGREIFVACTKTKRISSAHY